MSTPTRTRRRRSGALALLLVAAVGCGDGGGDGELTSAGGSSTSALASTTTSTGPTVTTAGAGAATTSTTKATAPDPSAKIAGVLQQAIARVAAAAAAGTSDLSTLSDPVVRVDAGGRIAVVLHASGPFPAGAQDAVRGLGAEIVSELAGPQAWLIEAWVPYDRIQVAAGFDWVATITPAEAGTTD